MIRSAWSVRATNGSTGTIRAIKRSYGRNMLHIELTSSKGFLKPRPGRRLDAPSRPGRRKTEADVNSQDTLKAAVQADVLITRFELLDPLLNTISIDRDAHA